MTWADAGHESDFDENRARRVLIGDRPVLVLRTEQGFLAVGNQCTHQGAALDGGVVRKVGSRRSVTCPAHGSMFDLETGRVMRPPATKPIPVYDVKVEDGRVLLRLRDSS